MADAKKSLKQTPTLDKVGDNKDLFHGRETAASSVRKYSMETEEASKSGARQSTVMGVVFPCMANILGVLLFLRLPWIVGKAGIMQGFLLVFVCCCCTFVTTLSLSAVATNGRILGGGSYFLISRSLGPALGAGVGLCFYMANSIGAAMYFMGTVEAWEIAQPESQLLTAGDINNIRLTSLCILVVALLIVAGGVKFVAKLGTVFLFIVLGVIACMYIGCLVGPGSDSTYEIELSDPVEIPGQGMTSKLNLEWSSPSGQFFNDNFEAAFDAEQYAFPADTTEHGFISLMALWFPAVTGIMAGSNRSSDLKDPAASIPKGTLTAQGITSIIYLSFVLVYGSVAPRDSLLHDKFFAASAAWPMKEFVMYGVMASTIGAGLTSLVSGCRLLSAIASDNTLPVLSVFAVPAGKEPRKALMASGVLCALAICIGELNAVAPVLTMFFLMCYTCVNMSVVVLEAVQDPNWRPRFPYHHWSISLLGAILCIWMMFAMSPLFAMIAIVFCSIVFTYASHNSHQVKWGDGFQGMKFQLARNVLTNMDLTTHTKNWRPQLLVVTSASIAERDTGDQNEVVVLDNPELLNLASQLKGGRGITFFGGVCISDEDIFSDGGLFLHPGRTKKVLDGQEAMSAMLREWSIEGFGRIVHTDDFSSGLLSLVQLSGLGAFQPNCVLACWPKEAKWKQQDKEGAECRAQIIRLVQAAVVFKKVMLLAKGDPFPALHERVHGFIDIWWIVADGGVLLLLPFLLMKHQVWKSAHTRLFVVADPQVDDVAQVQRELEVYVRDFRLSIEVQVRTITPEMEAQHAAVRNGAVDAGAKLQDIPVTTDELPRRQVSTESKESIGEGIANWRRAPPQGRESNEAEEEIPRIQSITSYGSLGKRKSEAGFPSNPPSSLGRQITSDQQADGGTIPNMRSTGSFPGKAQSQSAMFMSSGDQLSAHAHLSAEEMARAKSINTLMTAESSMSELVVTNLPDMPPGESAYGYFELVSEMTRGINRCFLVRGTAMEVITAFT